MSSRHVQYRSFTLLVCLSILFASTAYAQKLVLTNDDGWATAQIRKQYQSLKAANYDVRTKLIALNFQHCI